MKSFISLTYFYLFDMRTLLFYAKQITDSKTAHMVSKEVITHYICIIPTIVQIQKYSKKFVLLFWKYSIIRLKKQ